MLRALSPREQFRRWWQARLPLTDTWTLGQRNIYILPTRAGLTFALTFLLAGAGLVSMHLTHGNLRGLTLHLKPPASGYAGEPAVLEVVITNPGRGRAALALRYEQAPAEAPGGAAGGSRDAATCWCDVPAGGQQTLHLSLVPPTRGWHPVPTLLIETVFPFGLFRAWSIWRPAARLLAWPRPEQPAPPLPVSASAVGPETRNRRADGGEFDGVRPWRRGDTMRQVVWKKVARSNELVSRETAGTGRQELWLDWHATGLAGTEPRLSRLAAWVLTAERDAMPCGLRLPGWELAPGLGASHRREALDRLAQWT